MVCFISLLLKGWEHPRGIVDISARVDSLQLQSNIKYTIVMASIVNHTLLPKPFIATNNFSSLDYVALTEVNII